MYRHIFKFSIPLFIMCTITSWSQDQQPFIFSGSSEPFHFITQVIQHIDIIKGHILHYYT